MNLLVPIGTHMFDAAALQKAVADVVAKHPGKTTILSGQLDADGIHCVIAIQKKTESGMDYRINAAFTHSLTTGTTFAGGGSVAW